MISNFFFVVIPQAHQLWKGPSKIVTFTTNKMDSVGFVGFISACLVKFRGLESGGVGSLAIQHVGAIFVSGYNLLVRVLEPTL